MRATHEKRRRACQRKKALRISLLTYREFTRPLELKSQELAVVTRCRYQWILNVWPSDMTSRQCYVFPKKDAGPRKVKLIKK